MSDEQFLLKNISVDTNGDGLRTDGSEKTVSVWGTSFGGGTVAIQASPDSGTTWITLTEAGTPIAITSNEIKKIDHLGQGMLIRATLAGSSGASGVYVKIN